MHLHVVCNEEVNLFFFNLKVEVRETILKKFIRNISGADSGGGAPGARAPGAPPPPPQKKLEKI